MVELHGLQSYAGNVSEEDAANVNHVNAVSDVNELSELPLVPLNRTGNHIAFVKTHATGSSTVTSILHRYAVNHGVSASFRPAFSYPTFDSVLIQPCTNR